MSTPAQNANLARIRDNQRRSRARRREYLQELEQRLRVYELQGIEASAEVQMAARRVAGENKQLRELLHRYGASDDYIANYLQSGAVGSVDSGRGQPSAIGDLESSALSLEQLLLPRRPASFDRNVPFPLPSQSSGETSTAAVSTATSSPWEATQETMTPYGQQQQIGLAAAILTSSGHQQYSSTAFPANTATAGHESLSGPPLTSMLSDPRHAVVTTQPISMDGQAVMTHHYSMPLYHDAATRCYRPPDSSC